MPGSSGVIHPATLFGSPTFISVVIFSQSGRKALVITSPPTGQYRRSPVPHSAAASYPNNPPFQLSRVLPHPLYHYVSICPVSGNSHRYIREILISDFELISWLLASGGGG